MHPSVYSYFFSNVNSQKSNGTYDTENNDWPRTKERYARIRLSILPLFIVNILKKQNRITFQNLMKRQSITNCRNWCWGLEWHSILTIAHICSFFAVFLAAHGIPKRLLQHQSPKGQYPFYPTFSASNFHFHRVLQWKLLRTWIWSSWHLNFQSLHS